MATYSKADFERLAASIGKEVADIIQHEKSFEAAALWYRLDSRAPKAPDRIAPSTMTGKMRQIAKDARKLLGHLEVHDPREAPDGPGAIALLEFLESAEDESQQPELRTYRMRLRPTSVARIRRHLDAILEVIFQERLPAGKHSERSRWYTWTSVLTSQEDS